MRQVNDLGLELVKSSESLVLHSYLDPAGVWTIGYGHTSSSIVQGQTVNEAEAEYLLRSDLSYAEHAVDTLVTVPINDNQFAALVDFTFNLGAGAFQSSTLLKVLNGGRLAFVPLELKRWNKAMVNGVLTVLPGLVTRRAKECALWRLSC